MKKIAILGSTGSIGKNTLKVIDNNKDKFKVHSLSAKKNYKLLLKQYRKYRPIYLCIKSKESYEILKKELKDENVDILLGDKGLKFLGADTENDIVLNAVSGSCGLEATIEALKKGKTVALANKESLVSGGEFIKKILSKYKGKLIPVDSEHSAIFQVMANNPKKEIERVILTASGGAFRNYTIEKLKKVTVEDALKHPNWKMGQKITVDSASLVNKGLEIIEAHYLFDIPYEKIDFVVHPESIIHSMVEFIDKSIIAQMGEPDMRLPIHYALNYPNRAVNNYMESFDFMKNSKLSFEQLDRSVFRAIDYAYEAGKIGKNMPLIFNAANEEAVEAFLAKKINFIKIYDVIEKAMQNCEVTEVEDLEKIKLMEKEVRIKVREIINTIL
jgi:1-deoxy-D-xylulose-5-phosphate reductoisomerase